MFDQETRSFPLSFSLPSPPCWLSLTSINWPCLPTLLVKTHPLRRISCWLFFLPRPGHLPSIQQASLWEFIVSELFLWSIFAVAITVSCEVILTKFEKLFLDKMGEFIILDFCAHSRILDAKGKNKHNNNKKIGNKYALHNFKWVKIIPIWQNRGRRFWNLVDWCHVLLLTCWKTR